MIFAAGLGTRLRPITDRMPKALVPVGGQPLLWHIIMKLRQAGFQRLVVNVHHFAEQIIDYLSANDNFGLDIRISDESGGLLETGGGIRKALPLFDSTSPILIHNVDILSNLNLTEVYEKAATSNADALLVVSQRQTKRYLLFDDDMLLRGWTNIETGEVKGRLAERQLAFSGIHVLRPTVAPLLADWPERFPIMDFYLKTCGRQPIGGYEAQELKLLDVGKLDTLDIANTFIKSL